MFVIHQKLVIAPVKKELGLAFKGNQKKVVEALEVCYCTLLLSYDISLLQIHFFIKILFLSFPIAGTFGKDLCLCLNKIPFGDAVCLWRAAYLSCQSSEVLNYTCL